jgi:hypothetical protein
MIVIEVSYCGAMHSDLGLKRHMGASTKVRFRSVVGTGVAVGMVFA